jgi:hypothetical protein
MAASAATRCDNCGGTLAWEAASGRLRCDSCGAQRDAPAPQGDGIIREHDLHTALANQKPRGRIGAGSKQVTCQECSAVVEFPDGITATKCSFCDSPSVLTQDARADHVQPESLVPFVIDRQKSVEAYKKWLGSSWFRPANLSDKAAIAELKGIYVPFWTFDTEVVSNWQAMSGQHYFTVQQEQVMQDGKWITREKKIQQTQWSPASGQRRDQHDDFLVCASKGLPEHMRASLRRFDTKALVPFATQYLQGYSAESYAIDLNDAWRQAQVDLGREQEVRCGKDVVGDTHKDLKANHSFSSTRFKHVLLPVWTAAFKYNDKTFRYFVNGQTGEVTGQKPTSWTKVLIFIGILVAIIAFIVFLVSR